MIGLRAPVAGRSCNKVSTRSFAICHRRLSLMEAIKWKVFKAEEEIERGKNWMWMTPAKLILPTTPDGFPDIDIYINCGTCCWSSSFPSHPLLFSTFKASDEETHEQTDFLSELQGIHERKKIAQQKLEQFHHRQSVSYGKSTWLDSWPEISAEFVINECHLTEMKKLIKTSKIVSTAAFCARKHKHKSLSCQVGEQLFALNSFQIVF